MQVLTIFGEPTYILRINVIYELFFLVIAFFGFTLTIIYMTKYGELSKSMFRLFVVSLIFGLFYISIAEMVLSVFTVIFWLILLIGGIYIIITVKVDTETKKLLKINYLKLAIWMGICFIIIFILVFNYSTL